MRTIVARGLLVVLLGGLLVQAAPAQPHIAQDAAPEAMNAVQFLAGTWKGEGWMMGGTPERHRFVQQEWVRPMLDGNVLLIEGRGTAAEDTSLVIHRAVAVLGYDAQEARFVMRSFLPGGRTAAGMAHLDGDAFVWSPGTPNVRYTIRLDETGRWHEIGEMTRDDGATWFTFLEMTLERVAE